MSEYKITAHCTLCDTRCFDVLSVSEPHERFAGEPKQIGRPEEGATRIMYKLYDGTLIGLTFCQECSSISLENNFIAIWQKIIRTWMRELDGKQPDWFINQFNNGLLYEMNRTPWKELNG